MNTMQNHDNEPNITHAEEIRRELKVAPLSYTRFAPSWADGEGYGPGTYWVPVSRITIHNITFADGPPIKGVHQKVWFVPGTHATREHDSDET